jgi:GUN4-like
LDRVSIENSQLVATKFNECMAVELHLELCNISNSQFIGANLDSYFSKSNLSNSQWKQAHLCGCFKECDLTNAQMDSLFASNVEIINTIFPNGANGEMSWHEIQIEGEPPTPGAPIIHERNSAELKSAVGIDYTILRNLLSGCRWSEANWKTAELLWQILNNDSSYVEPEEIDQIPCIDLITIDLLWAENSWGHFGFTVQQEKWISIYGGYDCNPSRYKLFREVISRLDSRLGHSFDINKIKDEQSIKLIPIGFYPDTMFCMSSSEQEKILANLYRRLSECRGKGTVY